METDPTSAALQPRFWCKHTGMIVEQVSRKAYIDVRIGSEPLGRIVVDLYESDAPRAVENFLHLCRGDGPTGASYVGNCFHRVLKNFVIQAGDIANGHISAIDAQKGESLRLGQGNASAFAGGVVFEDENTGVALDAPFLLCMANNAPNTNGSQFFITTYPQPHLTGKHTVFGKVVHGKSVVREIERTHTDAQNVPVAAVEITGCGEWTEDMEVPIFNASYDPIGGDVFEEHPEDDTHIDHESSESVYNAASLIKESGTLLFKKGDKTNALFKYKKCLRYVMEYVPDEEQEAEWYQKYTALKLKLYLNLSLVCLQLQDYKRTIDYLSFLLEATGASDAERAKAHFRKGRALTELKQYKEAIVELEAARLLAETDGTIARELERAQGLLQKRKDSEKAKYAKFFG